MIQENRVNISFSVYFKNLFVTFFVSLHFFLWTAADLESCFIFVLVERLDKKTSLYILSNVGDQFCSVMQEEKKAFLFAGTDGKQGKSILFMHFISFH